MATKKTDPPREYANAVDKLRDEMVRKDSGAYVQRVGEFLTNYLLEHPEAEAAILAKDKSIAGSLQEMKKEARKHMDHGVGVFSDEEGFAFVLKYFGIDGEPLRPLRGHLPLKREAREKGTTEAKVSGGTVLSDTPTSTGGGQDAFATGRESPGVSGEPSPSDTGAGNPAKEEPDPFDLDALLGVM